MTGQTGWVCPVCNAGLAPWVQKCPDAHPDYSSISNDGTVKLYPSAQMVITCGKCAKIYPMGDRNVLPGSTWLCGKCRVDGR